MIYTIESIKIKQWLFLVLLTFISCNGNNSTKEGSKTPEGSNKKTPTVGIVNPQDRDFTSNINIVGTAMPNQVVELHTMESGYIKTMYKDIGDPVREGTVIAKLENPELMRNHQKQKALMEANRSIYERLQSIADKTPSLTSLDQVERAKADYQSALARYNATADRIGFLQLKSPFDGIVTKRFVDKGALVQSGTANPDADPVVEIMEVSTIRLSIPLPESDVYAVDKGTKASVVFPEIPGKTFEAKVSRMSGALNTKSKTMKIELDIENPSLDIKPGMYAKINMEVSSRQDVLSVPNTALAVHQDDFFIYTVENDIVQRVAITRGLSNKDYFEILEANIDTTAQVIVQGKNLIEPGMQVQPIQK